MKWFEYVLPPLALDVLRYLKNYFRFLPHFGTTRKNRQQKDSKLGKEVYVLANGPSLNNFPLEKLAGKEVVVMNAFHLAPWKHTVKIVAHCFGEPSNSIAWENPLESFAATHADTYWMHISSKQRLDAPTSLADKMYYVCPLVPTRLWRKTKQVDLVGPMLGYITTAQLAIMVAMYMGYKKITLLGFDHNWLAERHISPHFYEENDSVGKADLSGLSYYSLVNLVKQKWEIYYKLRAVAEANGCSIINLSQPSYLDVFPMSDKIISHD